MVPLVRRTPAILFATCWAVLLVGFSSAAQAQVGKPEGLYYKSWAVIIAIENYVVAPPVPGALEDGKRVAQALRQLGFDEVVEVYDRDATSRRLQNILTDMLPRKVGRMDRLVMFFVGHTGVTQDAQGKEIGYLVPQDAPVNNAAKAVTVEHLKEFTRRSASKHILLIIDAPIRGWETTSPQQLSLEGRAAPEEDTERRAVQVISAGATRAGLSGSEGQSVFVQTLLSGLSGKADSNQNGWLMASELGAYVSEQVTQQTKGAVQPVSMRIDGDGDTVLVEGRKAAFVLGAGPQTPEERQQVARSHYEHAFALLQDGKYADEALERLDKAIELDPNFGDAYVLKSYVRLEVLPNLDEALEAGRLAVKHAKDNPDSYYTLGLVYEKLGSYKDAEEAMLQAIKTNPGYQDVYFSLGTLYADHLNDQAKSVEAFRRYLELGGVSARARDAVAQADRAAKPAP
jgi:uncharacterized caspase-like protein